MTYIEKSSIKDFRFSDKPDDKREIVAEPEFLRLLREIVKKLSVEEGNDGGK